MMDLTLYNARLYYVLNELRNKIYEVPAIREAYIAMKKEEESFWQEVDQIGDEANSRLCEVISKYNCDGEPSDIYFDIIEQKIRLPKEELYEQLYNEKFQVVRVEADRILKETAKTGFNLDEINELISKVQL